jgi:hypothetical protein
MIGPCGAMLVLAMLAAGDEPAAHGARTTSAAALSFDESGSAYRERARSAVRDVLAKREFANLHSDPNAGWRQILAWLESLIRAVGKVVRSMPEWLFWMVLTWMVLTLLAILGHLVYTLVMLLRGTSLPGGSRGKRDKISGELLGIKDLDFDSVYAEARRLLAAGDWSAATRYFYVAAILWLDRQGWIVFKRSKTNRDYVAELARGAGVPALAGFSAQPPPKGGTPAHATGREQGFRRLTELFEPIVYGGREPTNCTMNDISTTLEELLHEPAVDRTR